MFCCQVNNSGNNGPAVSGLEGSILNFHSTTIRGGESAGISLYASDLCAAHCTISDNLGSAVEVYAGDVLLEDCHIIRNAGVAVSVLHNPGKFTVSKRNRVCCETHVLNRSKITMRMSEYVIMFSHCAFKANSGGLIQHQNDSKTIDGSKNSLERPPATTIVWSRNCSGDESSMLALRSFSWPTKSPRPSHISQCPNSIDSMDSNDSLATTYTDEMSQLHTGVIITSDIEKKKRSSDYFYGDNIDDEITKSINNNANDNEWMLMQADSVDTFAVPLSTTNSSSTQHYW